MKRRSINFFNDKIRKIFWLNYPLILITKATLASAGTKKAPDFLAYLVKEI